MLFLHQSFRPSLGRLEGVHRVTVRALGLVHLISIQDLSSPAAFQVPVLQRRLGTAIKSEKMSFAVTVSSSSTSLELSECTQRAGAKDVEAGIWMYGLNLVVTKEKQKI